MIREIRRETTAPAFSLDLAELDAIINRLRELFDEDHDGDNPVRISISLDLKNENLTFESVDEIRNYPELKGAVPNFDLSLSQGWVETKRISIRSYKNSAFFFKPSVWITGRDEAWCAGSMEVVMSQLRSHKAWYSFLLSGPVVFVLMVYLFLGPGLITSTSTDLINAWTATGLGLALLLWLCLFFFRDRIFPANILNVSDTQGVIRKYAVELTLAMAFISMIFTAIGIFRSG